MKRDHLIIAVWVFFFISCQSANKEIGNYDSSTIDTMAVTPLPSDSSSASIDTSVTDAIVNTDPLHSTDYLEQAEDYDFTCDGFINKQIKVKVNLFRYSGEQMGRVMYMTTKKIINMEVKTPSVGVFELTEKIEGKVTGIWKIEVVEEDIFKGTWYSPDGKKQMPIELGMTGNDFDEVLPKGESKTGSYEYKQLNDDPETKVEFPVLNSESLYIKNMSSNTLYFDLYIQGSPPGVHVGMVSGFAVKSGNAYMYKNDNGCEISMKFSGDEVSLSQKGSDMDCEFGAGIGAYGTLKKIE